MSSDPNLYVTQPQLPPLEDFVELLKVIWDRKILTNGGPFHQQLEQALAEHLGVKHLALLTNGTIALVTALQTLRIQGEVITTPYSFVATAHSLLWNGLEPVFADIDPHTCNLDPERSVDIMNLLADINARGTTILVATHDPNLLTRYRYRVIALRGGRLESAGV